MKLKSSENIPTRVHVGIEPSAPMATLHIGTFRRRKLHSPAESGRMPRVASSTGLIAARVRPVQRPKPKKVELLGSSIPAPFTLRPFAGLFNPFPYGCSVLCNHPADGEAKEVVRRAKDTWASEGKALLLPAEMELIRASLRTGRAAAAELPDGGGSDAVPEELFRRYTETDSRPASPASTELPDSVATKQGGQDVKERTTLVLDLRASSHDMQENETFSWHALTLEPIPSSRRSDATSSQPPTRRKAQTSSRRRTATAVSTSPARTVPVLEVSDAASTKSAPTQLMSRALDDEDDDDDDDDDDNGDEENSLPGDSAPMRRRGKLRRKKRKCRRGSIYGQQAEVRQPPEPLETQVSQIDEGSRRGSLCPGLEETKQASVEKTSLPIIRPDMPPSFLPPEIIKELSRELDREMVEWEFNPKRRIALEEALRVVGDRPVVKGPRSPVQPIVQNAPRLFHRQSARFELLDSQSLVGLKALDYLARHVFVSDARKSMFGRVFNRHREETSEGPRYMLSENLADALQDVMGRPLEDSEIVNLRDSIGEMPERLDFRMWCGICAFAERSLPELLRKEEDPASWLERADFETLERRLKSVCVDEKLAAMLRLIRDR